MKNQQNRVSGSNLPAAPPFRGLHSKEPEHVGADAFVRPASEASVRARRLIAAFLFPAVRHALKPCNDTNCLPACPDTNVPQAVCKCLKYSSGLWQPRSAAKSRRAYASPIRARDRSRQSRFRPGKGYCRLDTPALWALARRARTAIYVHGCTYKTAHVSWDDRIMFF